MIFTICKNILFSSIVQKKAIILPVVMNIAILDYVLIGKFSNNMDYLFATFSF